MSAQELRVFIGLFFIGMSFLCCKPAPPPVQHAPDGPIAIPNCAVVTMPRTEEVCDGMFTDDGLACVRCPIVGGCIDTLDQVYCIGKGGCLDDPLCHREQPKTRRRAHANH